LPATKRVVPPSPGAFPSYRGLFVGSLVGVVLIVGGLAFFPALALCSVAGHLALRCGLLVGLLVAVALIVGGLAFIPAFDLGPVMPAPALS
jgi:K+-transporting ATPase A subunit